MKIDENVYKLVGNSVRVKVCGREYSLYGRLLIADQHTGTIILAQHRKLDMERDAFAQEDPYELEYPKPAKRIMPSCDPKDYILQVILRHALLAIDLNEYSDENPAPLTKDMIISILRHYIGPMQKKSTSFPMLENARDSLIEHFGKRGIDTSIADDNVTILAFKGFVRIEPPYFEKNTTSRNEAFHKEAVKVLAEWSEATCEKTD